MKLARRNNVGLSPVDAFDRLFDALDRPFSLLGNPDPFRSLLTGPLNDFSYINTARHPIRKTSSEDGSLTLEFDVPGLSKEDLQVSYEDDIVTVTSVKKNESETSSSTSHLRYRVWAPDLNIDSITATCDKGVLTLSAKSVVETAPPKKTIEIK